MTHVDPPSHNLLPTLPGIETDANRRPLRVAIVSGYRAVVPHFETELDIAQQHLDLGDEVTFIHCDGKLANCEFNPIKDQAICKNCCGRRQMGFEMLSKPVDQILFHNDELLPEGLSTKFDSLASLIEYRWDGFDIGYAVLSSLVSFCRDPDPDLEKHADLIRNLMTTAWQTYQQSLSLFAKQTFDRVYVYNGRFAGMRSTLRACQKLNVDCYLHERGCDGQHFELLKNHLPHDLEAIEAIILAGWAAADETVREQVGESWFLERYQRVEKVWHSFTKQQEHDRLPSDWDPARKNVAIFCSSDDEFVAIGDAWRNELYPNQVDGIEQIVIDMLAREPATQIYLRMHPNLTGVDNQRCRRMKSLDYDNLTVIEPDAEIDTYRLVRDSDLVVTFGSSVGAEAVYWGTPSVLLGPCFYQNLGGVYRAATHEQTLDLLTQQLEPTDKTGVLKYGYWFQTRGYPHRYFVASGLFDGQFKSQTIYARPTAKPRGLRRVVGKLLQWVGQSPKS